MKIFFNAFASALWLLAATHVPALTFTNLYDFSADAFAAGVNPQATNSDGASPAGVVLVGNTIYGTASGGGIYGYGTIFRVNTDGTHFTNLFNFNQGTYDSGSVSYPDSTGADPSPGLTLVSNTLYGTTFYGGLHDAGTVFKINLDGSGFATVFSFSYTNGQGPADELTLYSNALYSTTAGGGTNQDGTIFKINLSDLSFATLYQFQNLADPYGGLVVSSNQLYGFAAYGGPSDNGYIYRVGIGGGGLTDLLDFDGTNGAFTYASPALSGNTLFGITYQGGTNGGGNIFRINTDGHAYTNLFSFPRQGGANTTGSNPYDFTGLLISGNKLYGSTSVSGTGGQGTLFQLNTDGTGFTVLHSFQYTDGGQPEAIILTNGILYGAAVTGIQGVSSGVGGIFSLILQPTLNLRVSSHNAILQWNDPSYSLYTAPTLAGTFTKITGAASPYTNAVSGAQKYFRLE